IERSLIPRCMAALANHVKKITCHIVNCDCPGKAVPVHIFSRATSQKLPRLVSMPRRENDETAAARKIKNIQGAATLENLASFSKPRMANIVIIAPTMKTVITHPALDGYISFKVGISTLKGMPTAVAETATIAPARKQNMRALT